MQSIAGPRRRIRPTRDLCYVTVATTDTKAPVGTIVGIGLVVTGLLVSWFAGVNTRIDDVRVEMRDGMERLGAGFDSVEAGLGKIDQCLLTIERFVQPTFSFESSRPAAPRLWKWRSVRT